MMPLNSCSSYLPSAYDDENRAVARYRVEIALRFPHSDERHAKYVIEMRKQRREEAAQKRQKDAPINHHENLSPVPR
jgi:hypothetical protein